MSSEAPSGKTGRGFLFLLVNKAPARGVPCGPLAMIRASNWNSHWQQETSPSHSHASWNRLLLGPDFPGGVLVRLSRTVHRAGDWPARWQSMYTVYAEMFTTFSARIILWWHRLC